LEFFTLKKKYKGANSTCQTVPPDQLWNRGTVLRSSEEFPAGGCRAQGTHLEQGITRSQLIISMPCKKYYDPNLSMWVLIIAELYADFKFVVADLQNAPNKSYSQKVM
jgi:hypothetical protein